MSDLPPRRSSRTTTRPLAQLRRQGDEQRRAARATREATAVLLADARRMLAELDARLADGFPASRPADLRPPP
jgi:hypothetical protein